MCECEVCRVCIVGCGWSTDVVLSVLYFFVFQQVVAVCQMHVAMPAPVHVAGWACVVHCMTALLCIISPAAYFFVCHACCACKRWGMTQSCSHVHMLLGHGDVAVMLLVRASPRGNAT